MNNKIIVPAIAIVAAGVLIFGIPKAANAQSPGQEVTSLIQMIAQKFGLKEPDVKAVFDQHKQQIEQKRETNYEDRLTQLVKDGKITDSQKTLILAKHKEIESQRQANMEKMKTMTADQRKAAMQTEKTDLENWGKQNNIDVKYLLGGDMGRWGMRMKLRTR